MDVVRVSFPFDSVTPRERKLSVSPIGKLVLRIENLASRRTTQCKTEITRRLVVAILEKDVFSIEDVSRLLGISTAQFNTVRRMPKNEYDHILKQLPDRVLYWPSGQYRGREFTLNDLNQWALDYGDKYVKLYNETKVPKGKRDK